VTTSEGRWLTGRTQEKDEPGEDPDETDDDVQQREDRKVETEDHWP
jgi:hypothetical protein